MCRAHSYPHAYAAVITDHPRAATLCGRGSRPSPYTRLSCVDSGTMGAHRSGETTNNFWVFYHEDSLFPTFAFPTVYPPVAAIHGLALKLRTNVHLHCLQPKCYGRNCPLPMLDGYRVMADLARGARLAIKKQN